MKITTFLAATFVVAFLAGTADADQLDTIDGSVLMGNVIAHGSDYTVRLVTGVTITVPRASIRCIAFGSGPCRPLDGGAPQPTQGGSATPLITPGVLKLAGSNTIGEKLAPALATRLSHRPRSDRGV